MAAPEPQQLCGPARVDGVVVAQRAAQRLRVANRPGRVLAGQQVEFGEDAARNFEGAADGGELDLTPAEGDLLHLPERQAGDLAEIGRASCRERGVQYG